MGATSTRISRPGRRALAVRPGAMRAAPAPDSRGAPSDRGRESVEARGA